MDKTTKTELVVVTSSEAELPPVLLGRSTPAVERQLENFYSSVAEIFERWVARRESPHTQRAYRQDVMAFCEFAGIRWPDDSTRLLTTSVVQIQDFRDRMLADKRAPKTINRRIASLSSFYKYLQGVASEFRLPITVKFRANWHRFFRAIWRPACTHLVAREPISATPDEGKRSLPGDVR